jgi:hypothetical protein
MESSHESNQEQTNTFDSDYENSESSDERTAEEIQNEENLVILRDFAKISTGPINHIKQNIKLSAKINKIKEI